ELDGRDPKIPSTQFCDREIEADPCVNDSVVVAERCPDVAFDDEFGVRVEVDAARGRLSLVSSEIDQIEIHGLEAGNLKDRDDQLATGQRFSGERWTGDTQQDDYRRHAADATPPIETSRFRDS